MARGATEATPGKYRICQHRQECSKHSGGKGPGTPSNDYERKLNVCSLRALNSRARRPPRGSRKISPREGARWVERWPEKLKSSPPGKLLRIPSFARNVFSVRSTREEKGRVRSAAILKGS